MCVMFTILTVTATVATCVWISGVVSLLVLMRALSLLSGATSSPAPAKTVKKEKTGEGRQKPADNVVLASKNGGHSQKENVSRRDENGGSAIKIEPTGAKERLYEEDTEGSDDTVGSYGAFNQYAGGAKAGDLGWVQPDAPVQLSEAEKMRRDIERSLK